MSHDFDIAAASYDDVFTNSKIGKAQRDQVHRYLDKVLASENSMRILELNAGTGEDAYHMSSSGHQVLATDISKEMIVICKKKYPNTKIVFQQLDISSITRNTFDQPFDLVFSNFGGFNCLSKEALTSFFKTAPHLLSEKGKLICVVMPKCTLWERIYFTLKGDRKKAMRRNSGSCILANVDGVVVKTWYFNPSDIINSKINLSVSKVKPIGLWVPPSYLEHSFIGRKSILSILRLLDYLCNWSFLSKYADHYYIELEKIVKTK
ncbi:class I SAM-dependent methyltransferase [Flavobacteriaceae bacterium S356]|uniref:Class I SAM-dependent methyltransferase n=1 Tax=Asprobacillus argus TaxID=3076534 RepID=A0ABU3LH54_9FLAO|nr:class I SAM-dependent methyltransferase [Flavobacteriaceae bacterium S356]